MNDFNDEPGRQIGAPRPRPKEEVWISQTDSSVWVEVTDHKGAPRPRSVSGKKSVLRIATQDRILCQEKVLDPANDPFTNGSLLRTDAEQSADPTTASEDALSDEQLVEMFGLGDEDFEDFVNTTSEVNARRMKAMALGINAGARNVDILSRIIETKYAVGGTTEANEQARALRQ